MVFSADYWVNAGGDDRRSDDDEPEPVGQLVTLEDLDEQTALEAGRKPMGRAETTGAAWVLEQVMPLFNVNRRAR